MRRHFDLAGRVVVVTGAANGIGAWLCDVLSRRGARVAGLDLVEPGDSAAGPSAVTRAYLQICDVTDLAAVQASFETIRARLGPPAVLINNAGITHVAPLCEADDARIRRVIDVNLMGAFHCTRTALPDILRARGHIAAVSSVAGFAPLLHRTAYAASKHALHGLMDSLRAELAGTGAGVTLICPSFTDTGIGSDAGEQRTTFGRPASPQHVAEALVEGIERRRRLVLPTTTARMAWLLSRVSPRLYQWQMLRQMRSARPS